jgi:hypothetical protein
MVYRDAEGDAAAERLERRWFAAFKAASAARTECEELVRVVTDGAVMSAA